MLQRSHHILMFRVKVRLKASIYVTQIGKAVCDNDVTLRRVKSMCQISINLIIMLHV